MRVTRIVIVRIVIVLATAVAVLIGLPELATAADDVWSAPTYLSPAGTTAYAPTLGLLTSGAAVAAWAENDAGGWRAMLASKPVGGDWAGTGPISPGAIDAPGTFSFGPRMAVSGDGHWVAAWLVHRIQHDGSNGDVNQAIVEGATGSVEPGVAPSATPVVFADRHTTNGRAYAYTPRVFMNAGGVGVVEYPFTDCCGGSFAGLSGIAAGQPISAAGPDASISTYLQGGSNSDDSPTIPAFATAGLNAEGNAPANNNLALITTSPSYADHGAPPASALLRTTTLPGSWPALAAATILPMPGFGASLGVLSTGKVLATGMTNVGRVIWRTGDSAATPIDTDTGAVGAFPQAAVVPYSDGSATIAYSVYDTTGGYFKARAVTVAADGGVSAPVNLSAPGADAHSITAAYGPDGTTYVAWSQTLASTPAQTGVFASIRPRGGSFPATPTPVFAGAQASTSPHIIAGSGNQNAQIVAQVQVGGVWRIAAFSHGTPATKGTVTGAFKNRDGKQMDGETVHVTGTTDDDKPVSAILTTNAAGSISTPLDAGTYTIAPAGDPAEQNGGTWAVASCDGTPKDDTCMLSHLSGQGTVNATFTYTPCSATDRHPNGKPPTGCPIIFVPGFLGSRITCGSKELWPNIPAPNFGEMKLEIDGLTNQAGPCNSNAGPPSGEAGLVKTAAFADIYGSAMDFLHQIFPDHVDGFAYDWRKSPLEAVPYLDKWINGVRAISGANRVVLMAHSMGGLVTRAYLADPAQANKVSRAITLGTPYWGAPKSHFSLLTAHTDAAQLVGLDALVNGGDLQNFARNAQGLYWLYPSAKFGPWLRVTGGVGIPGGEVGTTGTDAWVTSLGGTAALVNRAAAGHALFDDAPLNNVDYETVVGVGTATVTKVHVTLDPFNIDPYATVTYGSGDGTVPALSATQGKSAGRDPGVPVSYVCGVGHVSLPGDSDVQDRIKDFLLKGSPVTALDNNCAYTGTEVQGYRLPIRSSAAPRAAAGGAGGALTIAGAAAKGLAQVYTFGDEGIVTTDGRHPVTLTMTGKQLTFQTTKVSSSGRKAPKFYGPVNGTVTVSAAGAVKRSGKPLKADKADKRAPRTVAKVTKKGARRLVTLTAKDTSGVAATYVRIGTAKAKRYTTRLSLTAKQLRGLRFFSVDRFGNRERLRRAS